MIRYLMSSDPRFKVLDFSPGLNIVLADRTESSTDKDSRNGLGKSSLVRLLHFLLGGTADKKSLFRKPELLDHFFTLGLDHGNLQVAVTRSGISPNSHYVAGITDWDRHLEIDPSGIPVGDWEEIRLQQWRHKLGGAFFGLPADHPPFSPSVRSLLSYLIRRERDGGFAAPFKHSHNQQSWDTQVSLSYLLDLRWSIQSEFEKLRKEQMKIDSLKKAVRSETFGEAIGSAAELRTEVAIAKDRANGLRRQVDGFTVIDGYADYLLQADALTRQIRELDQQDAIDRELLADLEEVAASEAPPQPEALEYMWESVNVLLPEQVLTRYEDVQRFHESVIKNRLAYLNREAEQAHRRVEERHIERERADSRRSELMRLLSSGGALDQFRELEAEAARLEGEARELERRHEFVETFETGSTRTEQQRGELLLRLKEDNRTRSDRIDRAIVLFQQYSESLYGERRGSLVIHETSKGLAFDVEITGRGSVGIDSMQILCFDLMLMTLLHERNTGPRFLVHDSHIFDGVDERQIANALMLGARLTEELGFQYIVMMNSDTIPAFPEEFDFEKYVNPVRLTDASGDGGLFGFKFD